MIYSNRKILAQYLLLIRNKKSFDSLINARNFALRMRKICKSENRKNQLKRIVDLLNGKLNRIRINETPLRPAVFARTNYS